MASVTLTKVLKTYSRASGGTVQALAGVSFHAADQELLTVVGPSGSGKSTLLRIISGLERPDSGTVQINEEDVTKKAPHCRNIAMVLQNPALFPHLTAYQNIAFGLRVRKFGNREIEQRVHAVADLLGLSSELTCRPMELSGGQRQRVALGRALARRPQILLLDEPLANIDPLLRDKFRADLRRIQAEYKTTILYVTHDHLEAMLLGHRILVLCEGGVQQLDTPERVYAEPRTRFVAEFIGAPKMNFFEGFLVLKNGQAGFRFSAGGATRKEPGGPGAMVQRRLVFSVDADHSKLNGLDDSSEKPVVLGLRPEDIEWLSNHFTGAKSEIIEARIIASETTGADSFVSAVWGQVEFVARLSGAVEIPPPGGSCVFRFRMPRASLFDAKTGMRMNMK